MPKKPLNKIRYPFLEGPFSENPVPYKKLNRKAIKISILSNKKGLTKKIRNIQKNIIEQETVSKIHKKTKFNNILTDKSSICNQTSQTSRRDVWDVSVEKKPFSVFHTPNVPKIPKVKDVKYGSKNSYLKNTEKQHIVTTKYIFSLEQLKAQLYKKQSQHKKSSVFKNVLLERKKCSVIYGSLGEKQMNKVIVQAKHCDGKFDENFIKIVESRLDVALYRICFFPSIISAKQWIYHGNVLVNKKVNTLPGYILKAGDVISISSEKKTILKEKISFIIAKRLKIRESHYLSKINSFYTVVKNLVKYQDKNYSIYIPKGCTHNNKLLSTQHKSVRPVTKNIFVKDVDTCYPSDENKKRIYQKDIYHQEELRRLNTFLKKIFQGIKSKISDLISHYNINRSIYLLPKVYPFFSLFLSPKTKSHKIDKIFSTFYPFLKIRNLFTSARPLKQRTKSIKISGIKPLNLEVCYKNMVAIFLYSPQKVALPATIDLPLIAKNY